MPYLPRSNARPRTIPFTPALVAEYGEMLGYAANDAEEEVTTIDPPPLARIGAAACLHVREHAGQVHRDHGVPVREGVILHLDVLPAEDARHAAA
jgi:hypothetical protein